jgi:hypothetical protein
MSRPVPLILSAIVLGLLAIVQILGAGSTGGTGLLLLHHGMPHKPGMPVMPLPDSFFPIMMFVLAFLFLAAAAWSITTIVGLARLRSWARYSTLIIAGLITLFAGVSTITSIATPLLVPSTPDGQPMPHMIHTVFFVMAAIYAIVTAIAIAMLVYFNLPATRAIFLQNAPVSYEPPNTTTGRPRPVAISIISWVMLISSPVCLLYLLLPIPAFLFGFVITGLAAKLIYLVFGILAFTIGYGLYRLRNEARLAMFGWMAFGIINMLVTVTPWGLRNFRSYMDAFNAKMFAGLPIHSPTTYFGPMVIGMGFGIAFYIFLVWLLQRHRIAFTPLPEPPPMPTLHQAAA